MPAAKSRSSRWRTVRQPHRKARGHVPESLDMDGALASAVAQAQLGEGQHTQTLRGMAPHHGHEAGALHRWGAVIAAEVVVIVGPVKFVAHRSFGDALPCARSPRPADLSGAPRSGSSVIGWRGYPNATCVVECRAWTRRWRLTARLPPQRRRPTACWHTTTNRQDITTRAVSNASVVDWPQRTGVSCFTFSHDGLRRTAEFAAALALPF